MSLFDVIKYPVDEGFELVDLNRMPHNMLRDIIRLINPSHEPYYDTMLAVCIRVSVVFSGDRFGGPERCLTLVKQYLANYNESF